MTRLAAALRCAVTLAALSTVAIFLASGLLPTDAPLLAR